ncbi:proteasome subunit alpha [Rhodococcus sp. X156]|uniref:proteasome subunit alpha n=1 Tax=Rhodococcus sp. X156 TaxID=2499145 RepID=UPI000FDC8A5B|nr:proteasome subunit alpha [Rhodococcus sp. X156]
MTMPYYASAEQIMRDRSELARKGIGRGRSVVVLTCADGVLFVAENPSATLHKVSEIYDRIGFAAVGKYNEFENLRRAGIQHADLRGYSYDRRDVTGQSLANAYAQTLGTIFTEQPKPYEVEICVAEVGRPEASEPVAQLYRITYDGSIADESRFIVMGGSTEPLSAYLKEHYQPGLQLKAALELAVAALQQHTNGGARSVPVDSLEVAVLEQARPRRAFRRLAAAQLATLLPAQAATSPEPAPPAGEGTTSAGTDETPDPGPGPVA